MKTVLISKDKLLVKMKENRESHLKQYEEALDGWKEKVINELEKALKNAREFIEFKTFLELPKPTDHTSDYDEIIARVEWNEEKQIALDQHDFNQFVLDDWNWKHEFIGTTALYSKLLK